MIKILSIGFVSALCGFGIYLDYHNRINFHEFIKSNRAINGNRLIDGVISVDNYDNCDEQTESEPFVLTEHYTKNYIQFYDYDYCYYTDSQGREYRYTIHKNIRFHDYWTVDKTYQSINPRIRFNNQPIIYNSNLKIFYPKNNYIFVSPSKYIIKKYIPNNSTTTVFGKMNNHGHFKIEFIGNKSDIKKALAHKYFGISTEYSLFLACAFAVSSYCIFDMITT